MKILQMSKHGLNKVKLSFQLRPCHSSGCQNNQQPQFFLKIIVSVRSIEINIFVLVIFELFLFQLKVMMKMMLFLNVDPNAHHSFAHETSPLLPRVHCQHVLMHDKRSSFPTVPWQRDRPMHQLEEFFSFYEAR